MVARARPAFDDAPAARPVPAWLVPVCVAAGLVGLGTSVYLTIVHYTSPSLLVCGAGGLVNCEAVTTSAQSMLLGIPVAVLGMAWFLAILAFVLPWSWRSAAPWVGAARLLLTVGGIGFVLYLVYAELFVIGAICLWCTVAHVMAFVLFVCVVLFTPLPRLGSFD